MSDMSERWTFHGGRLSEARSVYGDGAEPWLDLSTGINPHCWPGVRDLPIDWRALPDERSLIELEAAAAACFSVHPDHLCALPGTEIGLRLLGDVLPGKAFHLTPSYRTHAEMFIDSTPITFDELENASGGTVILANPNNPDGRTIMPDFLADRLGRLSASSGWLVVDEAFADAVPEASLATQVRDNQRLILFRSFGKFFGLPGVRLGFVLGPRSLIARFRAKLGSWRVSAAALAIGTAAYRHWDWITDMRQTLHADAAALDAVLARHGFMAIGDCPLFRLIQTEQAAVLFDNLARHAILTRPFDYNSRWLRLGLPGSDQALARSDQALRDG